MASSAPRGLRSDHVVTVGIALFSMLFGAGNLIICLLYTSDAADD